MSVSAPIIENPIQLDKVLGEIQAGLVENISWLDVAFGKAQRVTRMVGDKRIVSPNVYCGGWNGHGNNDYIEVLPDARIGNFSFFVVDDPQTITPGPWAREIKAPFALIVWLDLRKVYPGNPTNRNTELLKAEILNLLNGRAGWHLSEGRIVINRIYELAENIYRGYTISEIDNQYLIHPYAGFRFEGLLEVDEHCFAGPEPPAETWYYKTKDGIYYGLRGGGRYIVKH